MRKYHLVVTAATVALAVLGLVAPVAHAAGDAAPRAAAGTTAKSAKKSVKKPARKNAGKAGRKPAAQPARTASRPARSRLAAQPQRKPPAAARALQLPPRTITAAQPRTDVRTRITKPGDYRFALQHDGRTRTYRVHVPPGLDFHEPAPLVVALHGAGIGEQDNAGLDGMERESDRQRFVSVFPDAYRAAGSRAGWNAAGALPVDDVGFIDKVVDNVFRQLSISRLEIYAAGMADGGSMAYRLACERPHLFRAVASVGGADPTAQCAPDKPVSVLHFQAKNDAPTVLASLAGAGAGSGSDRGTQAAAETAAKWARLNGCMEAPQRVLDMSGAYCEAYSYCRQQTEVRLCVTDGAGPAWPGAPKPGARPASHAISATSTMWGFFSSR